MATIVQYEIFKVLVETKSFSKTAIKLNMTQSAVSHAIKSLEKEWGLLLFHRNTNYVRLTSDGQQLLHSILQILHWQEQLTNELSTIKNVMGGTIKIGVLPSIEMNWLPSILKYFHAHYPDVELQVYQSNYDQLEDWVLDETIDLAFSIQPSKTNFDFKKIQDDELLCILPASHPLGNQPSIRLTQLKNEQWVMPKKSIDRNVNSLIYSNHLHPTIMYESDLDHALLAMVEQGVGITIMPKLLLYNIPLSISCIPFEEKYMRTLGIVTKKNIALNTRLSEFIAIVEQLITFD
ncbi:LysR family transcriptional regulator [Lysinibacillus sp. KU-BSD001]|uniref:LysR family transcriptional regulator n=1 Tax=Lysinibacillus sp. KU-BSD001 TaxID=3141328 RepID=UPI0036F16EC4